MEYKDINVKRIMADSNVEQNTPWFTVLYLQIHIYIYSLLKYNDILNCLRVCKGWRKILSSPAASSLFKRIKSYASYYDFGHMNEILIMVALHPNYVNNIEQISLHGQYLNRSNARMFDEAFSSRPADRPFKMNLMISFERLRKAPFCILDVIFKFSKTLIIKMDHSLYGNYHELILCKYIRSSPERQEMVSKIDVHMCFGYNAPTPVDLILYATACQDMDEAYEYFRQDFRGLKSLFMNVVIYGGMLKVIQRMSNLRCLSVVSNLYILIIFFLVPIITG